jgi:hypothetical protein
MRFSCIAWAVYPALFCHTVSYDHLSEEHRTSPRFFYLLYYSAGGGLLGFDLQIICPNYSIRYLKLNINIMRLIITILVYSFIGWLLCNIDAAKEYAWYSGIWHGMFFIPNLIRSWFSDALYKAEFYTTAYNVFYWIFSILSVIGFLFRPSR